LALTKFEIEFQEKSLVTIKLSSTDETLAQRLTIDFNKPFDANLRCKKQPDLPVGDILAKPVTSPMNSSERPLWCDSPL